MLETLLGEGSLLLIFGLLVGAGTGAPISEDLCILAAGALAQQGLVELPLALLTCLGGVVLGDLLLFTIASKIGRALFETRAFRRVMPDARREKLAALVARRGGLVVFAGRFMVGLRWPVLATVAVNGYPRARFMAWDALGAAISVPIMFSIGFFSAGQLEVALQKVGDAQRVVLVVVMALVAAVVLWQLVARRRAM